jgi:hypothetical protein
MKFRLQVDVVKEALLAGIKPTVVGHQFVMLRLGDLDVVPIGAVLTAYEELLSDGEKRNE